MENKLVTYKYPPALALDTGHERKFPWICVNMSKIYFKIVSSRVNYLIHWKAITKAVN